MSGVRLPSRTEAAFFALSALAFSTQLLPHLALINETRSLPRGVYVRTFQAQPGRGDIVALRGPPAARAYLAALGHPREDLILKRIAATPGEPVCRRDDLLHTPGGAVRVHRQDRRGRTLPSWTGCGALPAGAYFLLGDSADSFDSRYFGPVRREALEGPYRALVRW